MPRLLKYLLQPSFLDRVDDTILESAEVGLVSASQVQGYMTFAPPGWMRAAATSGLWYAYAHILLPGVKASRSG